MVDIVIDNREKYLLELFEKNNVTIQRENLDIGDIIFKKDNEPVVIIERKTLSDLSKSIKDGRYKEQKKRLRDSIQKNVRKVYIIEGNNKKDFSLPNSTYRSCIVNTTLRDEIYVFETNTLEKTYELLLKIHEQLPKYIKSIINDDYHEDYINTCRTNKKANITPEVCGLQQLCQVPGVSSTLAIKILDKYKTMKNLYRTILEKEDNMLEEISEIKYGKNNRRIGNKTATKILHYLN